MISMPLIAPRIRREPLPGESFVVRRRDVWGVREIGSESVTGFYYRYEGREPSALYFGRNRAISRLRYKDCECLEIATQTLNPGQIGDDKPWESTSLHSLEPEGHRHLLSIHRDLKGGVGSVQEFADAEVDPWELRIGMKRSASEEKSDFPKSSWEVTGTCRLTIGDREFRCLRQLVSFVAGERRWLTEVFFSDEGEGVLIRGYEAETGDQYPYCEKEPSIDFEGMNYRLLCDMIPDNALSDADDARREGSLSRFGRM